MYLYLKNINHFKKMKGGEIFKYFGQCGRMFIKCTTLSHIAHNGMGINDFKNYGND